MISDLLSKLFYRSRFYLDVPGILQLLKFRELRNTYYSKFWDEAAHNVGAKCNKWDFGYTRISRDSMTTFVKLYSVMMDNHLTLDIMGNKALTYTLLADMGYPLPKFRSYTMHNLNEAEAFLENHGGPLVIKPTHGTGGGRGVTTGITDLKALRKASRFAASFCSDLLIEEQIEGHSYRLLYLDGKLIDAVRRDPPVLTGDGHHSIRRLVAMENHRRFNERPVAALSPLKIDRDCINTLRVQGLSTSSILSAGQTIIVKKAINENRSEQNHIVTDQVHPEIIALGSKLISDLGVQFAGLDILCKDIGAPLEDVNGLFNEVNTTPGLHHHYLVTNPKSSTPVAEQVLEYMFSNRIGIMLLDKQQPHILPTGTYN